MVKRKKFTAGRGYSEADWQDVDSPALTDSELAQAKPFAEILPQFGAALKGRGKQKQPTKELISLRLNRATLAAFRAQGTGWQKKIDDVLTEAAKAL